MTAEADDARTRQIARLRDYLTTESAERDFIALWPTVVRARLELLALLEPVSQGQAEWKPAGEGWSIVEVARHALNASRDVLRVIEALASGAPAARSTGPGAQPESAPYDIAALRRQLTEHSVDFAALPTRLPAQPDLVGAAAHAFFGDLNCRGWFLFQEVHDRDHIGQIGKIVAAPGYPAR